ncbi:zinc ribbon domain-containing protein [uncultured Clostridium sp.]|uniref:zinc ribbon domain-containing protein n=1 Tax=uncultured Clostridium sp. TaxID=59620 RepID=UPI0025ED1A44|nr:zinc-ribbon domain-containing protein [uncultured Clostridium sp.]
MFCKNCGSPIKDGDVFCGNCGQPVDSSANSGINRGSSKRHADVSGSISFFECIKTYFNSPLSFFTKMRNTDLIKKSIALIIGLPIMSGLLNILYNSAVLNSLFNAVKNLPDLLVKSGFIDSSVATTYKSGIVMSDEFYTFKNRITTLIDNKDIFVGGFVQVISIIIATIVAVELINTVFLKKKIEQREIVFISSASYIPLVISIALAALVSLLSILFGLLIVISGYILSFITLYSGLKQYSSESSDKIFMLMSFLFILVSAILSFVIMKEFENSLVSIAKAFQSVKNFL